MSYFTNFQNILTGPFWKIFFCVFFYFFWWFWLSFSLSPIIIYIELVFFLLNLKDLWWFWVAGIKSQLVRAYPRPKDTLVRIKSCRKKVYLSYLTLLAVKSVAPRIRFLPWWRWSLLLLNLWVVGFIMQCAASPVCSQKTPSGIIFSSKKGFRWQTRMWTFQVGESFTCRFSLH